MDIYVDTGTLQNTPMKSKIIVELLMGITIMMEGLGVMQLMVSIGKDVVYQDVQVSKITRHRKTQENMIIIQTYVNVCAQISVYICFISTPIWPSIEQAHETVVHGSYIETFTLTFAMS